MQAKQENGVFPRKNRLFGELLDDCLVPFPEDLEENYRLRIADWREKNVGEDLSAEEEPGF